MENLPKKLHVYVVYSSDGLCAQFFYEILEFVKVGKSAKKIACICSLSHLYDMRPFDKRSSALRASLHSLAAQVSTCKYAEHGFSTKFWNLEKLENLPKKLHVYVMWVVELEILENQASLRSA